MVLKNPLFHNPKIRIAVKNQDENYKLYYYYILLFYFSLSLYLSSSIFGRLLFGAVDYEKHSTLWGIFFSCVRRTR